MILAALLLAQTVPAPAAAPACPAIPAALPTELAGWSASSTDLASMKAVTLTALGPGTARPAGVPESTRRGFSAVATFRIATAGNYGVALGARGWIDVYPAGQGTALKLAGHGHAPACTGIAKIVRYTLVPGEYRLVVDGLDERQVKAMLVR